MRRLFRSFRASRRGTAGTEFAFILPVMLLFIAAIVEFGRFFLAYTEVNRLATRYAIAYADCVSACNVELQTTFGSMIAMKNLAPQLSNTSAIVLHMYQVTMSSATPPAAAVTYSLPASATLTAPELTAAQTSIAAGQPGVVVSLKYTHQLLFFSSIMAQFIPTSLLTVTYTVAQQKNS